MNTSADSRLNLKTWLSLLILALSVFTIVTTELAPIGLLTPIAQTLHQNESTIGITVTLYAWIGALSALLASIFWGNLQKKPLLLFLIFTIFIANGLSAIANNISMLMFSRIVGAFAHGSFWAMIGVTAISLVPARFIGLATSVVFGGVTAASVIGVPLTNYIGLNIGWRNAFWLMSFLSIIAFLGIFILVPSIKTNSNIGVSSLKIIIRSKLLWKIYIATLLTITAHFSAFTFIEPWLQGIRSLSNEMIPLLLFIFGLSGLIGNFISGVLIDKFLKHIISIAMFFIAFTLIILGFFSQNFSQNIIMILVVIWGISIPGIFIGFQTWVIRLSGENAFPATAIYVSFFNVAIGCGALLGALFISFFNVNTLLIISGITIGIPLILIAIIPVESKISNENNK